IRNLIDRCEAAGFAVRASVLPFLPSDDAATNIPAALGGANSIVIGAFALPREADNEARTPRAAPGDERLDVARRAIEQRYYTPLSCDALARLAGMTKFNFIHAFTAAFGVSPYQYLIRTRVEHARQMLALTDQPLRLIAASVGFRSASSLARAFKRFAGASPARVVNRIAPARVRDVVAAP
ncbi:MAG TPA: AraC family transcriptional regulator, partial [Rudaea sp.]